MENNAQLIRQKLTATERRLRPTADERSRAEAAMWELYETLQTGGQAGEQEALTNTRRAQGRTEIALIPTVDVLEGRPRMVLRAAAVLVVAAIALGLWLTRSDAGNFSTETAAEDQREPSPSITALDDVVAGGSLGPGTYETVLAGLPIRFDLDDDRNVIERFADRVVLEAQHSGVGSAPKQVTIAVVTELFGGAEPDDWFEANGVVSERYPRVTDAGLADDYELTVEVGECRALQTCLTVATGSTTGEPLWVIDGSNRLLLVALDDGRSLVVLDTAGGNRSGPSQRGFNTIAASITVAP